MNNKFKIKINKKELNFYKNKKRNNEDIDITINNKTYKGKILKIDNMETPFKNLIDIFVEINIDIRSNNVKQ